MEIQTKTSLLALTVLVVTVSSVQLGCSKPKSDGEAPAPSAISQANLSPVQVPAEGKEFKPPIRAEQLPSGAWYCDMGTVHWAQMNEGNHTCPICKMDLKKR